MARAEALIRQATQGHTPGACAANILHAYRHLSSEVDRAAFVAVLANRLALSAFVATKCASPSA